MPGEGVLEAGQGAVAAGFGNLLDGERAGAEQAAGFFQAQARQFPGGGGAELFLELAFELMPRQAGRPHQVPNPERFFQVLAHPDNRRPKLVVGRYGDRQRTALNDFQGIQADDRFLRFFTLQDQIQKFGRLPAHPFLALVDRGNRGMRTVADQLVVVDPDHPDLLGDGDPGVVAGIENQMGEHVVGTEDPDIPGEFPDDRQQPLPFRFPDPCRGDDVLEADRLAVHACRQQDTLKTLQAVAVEKGSRQSIPHRRLGRGRRPAAGEMRRGDKEKMAVPVVKKTLGGEFPDPQIIDKDLPALALEGVADIDDHQSPLLISRNLLVGTEYADDPGAGKIGTPLNRLEPMVVGGLKVGRWHVGDIIDNAFKHPMGIAVVDGGDKGDVPAVFHSGRFLVCCNGYRKYCNGSFLQK